VCGPPERDLRRLVAGAAVAAGFYLHFAVTVDRLLSVLLHVCAGVGIGVLPEGCLPPMQWGVGFHPMLLSDPPLSVSIGLITLRGRYLTPAASGLLSLVHSRAGKRQSDGKCTPVTMPAVALAGS
jgi:DNA-binding transcriptional LysR family regulator